MRLNRYIALATGLSRRAADKLITEGRVNVNGRPAELGAQVNGSAKATLDDRPIQLKPTVTILLNKPVGYVCSRRGQGHQTIYNLLPTNYQNLKPVGRLDKDSSGLLLLTNDGQLAQQLTHPSFQKQKVYEIRLDKPLAPVDKQKIEAGVKLEDGLSRLQLNGHDTFWTVTMSEGRSRQIRRSFAALGYVVIKLHRTTFGPYSLDKLGVGNIKIIF